MVNQTTAITVDGSAVEGWERTAMQASTRGRFPWHDMCSELIDNALEFMKPKEGCKVMFDWVTTPKSFACRDSGKGGTDPELFLRPGKTGGHVSDYGNSTFGTGLFAIECHLDAKMTIATRGENGTMAIISRRIQHGQTGSIEQFKATREQCRRWRVCDVGGTTICFTGFQRGVPKKDHLPNILKHLSRCYRTVLGNGQLSIIINHNGKTHHIKPADQPQICNLHQQTVTIDGHAFVVEWGVTKSEVREIGVQLIYGGKLFDSSTEPCGDANLGRFYAAITIPRSIGLESMELLKRGMDHPAMDTLYSECRKVFGPQLKESDDLCRDDSASVLNKVIGRMLSRGVRRDKKAKDDQGGQDLREYKGRDMDSEGVKPKETGRTRRGRKGSKAPEIMKVDWVERGLDKPQVEYDPGGHRLTYNASHPLLVKWKAESSTLSLATLGAAYVAHTVWSKRVHEFDRRWPERSFVELLRELTERIENV